MEAFFEKYILRFKNPSGTSRGILKEKETFFIHVKNKKNRGCGECAILRKLSIDDRPDYTEKLDWTCKNIHLGFDYLYQNLKEFPSIRFGLEQAFLDLNADQDILFPSEFTYGKKSIKINGLIWMGSIDYMKEQIEQKIKQGFSCLKIKIGSLDFQSELTLLEELRNNYPQLTIRVDANGAFSIKQAAEKIYRLAKLKLHSIEQPIQSGKWEEMTRLCQATPLPIALDEELIGIFEQEDKIKCLDLIKPQYIVLKPALLGGLQSTQEWIDLANKRKIGWWITSALESNVGLNTLSQWTYTLENNMPQGLGTGGLYINNLPSKLQLEGENLFYRN